MTDDHPLMREGINAVIQGAEDIIVVADADNGQQALEMFRVHRPDVTHHGFTDADYERYRCDQSHPQGVSGLPLHCPHHLLRRRTSASRVQGGSNGIFAAVGTGRAQVLHPIAAFRQHLIGSLERLLYLQMNRLLRRHAGDRGAQTQYETLNTLQQRVVQIACDSLAFDEALLTPERW
jgi:DNA-binding NarL/FixJ family response regulator